MQRLWLLRLIEVVAAVALIAEIWRFVTTNNTTQDVVADALEVVGLMVVGLVCLYAERRIRRAARERSQAQEHVGEKHG